MFFRLIKIYILAFILLTLSSCSGFKPLYKNNLESFYELQGLYVVTDKKKISKKIKKSLIELFPINKKAKYILKVEGNSQTSATISDTARNISRYKTEVSAKVKLYYRGESYDKLIYQFDEKRQTSYSLIMNNVRSTMASRKSSEATGIKLLSDEIYKRILIYLSSK